ncbi:universal stress protein [Thermophagus sp. OGC60D27]|uniref:universal stress protein n=1 Tax=Thermophagus sp. OGC60D27 TaxID=3458415 RepID=UPI004037F807
MKHIILLTDFSETARNAALYALKMFKNQPVRFLLLNCFDVDFSGSPYIIQVKEEMAEESRRGLRQELSRLHAQFPNARIKPLSGFGPITEVIRKAIEEHHPELVVLGCKGETALEHLLLGSNALDVINNIHHPTLVVPINAQFISPKKIVFATDLQNTDLSPLADYLNDLIKSFNSELLFLNIVEDRPINRLETEEKLASYFPGVKLNFYFEESDGDNCQTILKFMEEHDATMLILFHHHRKFFQNIFQSHLIKKMILHPQHPMFILHEKQKQDVHK